MRKPLYWKYIIISLVSFVVLFHVGAIIYLNQGPSYELTSSDYYEKGQAYEQEIQALNRGMLFSWDLDVSTPGKMRLSLVPKEGPHPISPGVQAIQIELLRPNDSTMDSTLELIRETNENQFSGDHQLKKGRWHARLKFIQNDQEFLFKKAIVVP